MPARKRSATQTPVLARGPFPFTYDEFEDWYARLEASILEPTRLTFVRILNETLDAELNEVDRLRIRVSHSRIKRPARLWNKMLGEKYSSKISSLTDIPAVVDDLVGVRVTCNNLVDAKKLRNIIISFDPKDDTEMPSGICIDPESERRHEKPSGYRAYHINLHTLIQAREGWLPARGELQVRTLLQDSWGELTHEDTYKPGTQMPPIVTKIAKRMADLLAAVDDLAQDLRDELDELARRDVEPLEAAETKGPDSRGSEPAEAAARAAERSIASHNVRDALISETRSVVRGLKRPVPLAQVAWQVQGNFGRDVAGDWGGFGSFKHLLREAAPEVTIVETPPGTVIPPGIAQLAVVPSEVVEEDVDIPEDDIPALAKRLKQHDSRMPAVSSTKLARLLDAVVASLDASVWESLSIGTGAVGTRELNQLTKWAKEWSEGPGREPAKRAWLDYILKSLYFSGNLRPGISRSEVLKIAEAWLFARASGLGLVVDAVDDRESFQAWFESAK